LSGDPEHRAGSNGRIAFDVARPAGHSRFGIVSARVNKLRERAKGDFGITIARLSVAVSRPIADKQRRLRLR
jgi:hypothetical protein